MGDGVLVKLNRDEVLKQIKEGLDDKEQQGVNLDRAGKGMRVYDFAIQNGITEFGYYDDDMDLYVYYFGLKCYASCHMKNKEDGKDKEFDGDCVHSEDRHLGIEEVLDMVQQGMNDKEHNWPCLDYAGRYLKVLNFGRETGMYDFYIDDYDELYTIYLGCKVYAG